MSPSRQTQAATRMFARVIGPFLVIITATVIARAADMRMLATEFRADSLWPWVTGAFVLLCGLIVVAFHQKWRGAPAIIVSLLGWLTTLKGSPFPKATYPLSAPPSTRPPGGGQASSPWHSSGYT
jgi:hypothetical protein